MTERLRQPSCEQKVSMCLMLCPPLDWQYAELPSLASNAVLCHLNFLQCFIEIFYFTRLHGFATLIDNTANPCCQRSQQVVHVAVRKRVLSLIALLTACFS